jgi:hypothetical protein
MSREEKLFAIVGMAVLGIVVVSCVATGAGTEGAPGSSEAAASEPASQSSEDQTCPIATDNPVEIATAMLIIEFNATDGDLGVHGLFDDAGWSKLCVIDPSGRQILGVAPHQQLGDLTMASIFFESREPPLDEFGFAELADRFPEGSYEVLAESVDGTVLSGAARFSHNVPAEPQITSPELADDEENAGEALVAASQLTVAWEPVTETMAGDPVTISAYEVIITKVDHDDPYGFSRPEFDVHVLPTVTTLGVPSGFLEPYTLYELEVLAVEESGNQTISVGFFTTGP